MDELEKRNPSIVQVEAVPVSNAQDESSKEYRCRRGECGIHHGTIKDLSTHLVKVTITLASYQVIERLYEVLSHHKAYPHNYSIMSSDEMSTVNDFLPS